MLYLCEREHVEGGMIFQLLEDLTEMSTMRNCKDIFGYIESKQDILGKVTVFSMDILIYFSGVINHWNPWLIFVLKIFGCITNSKSFLLVGNLWCWEHAINFFVVYQRLYREPSFLLFVFFSSYFCFWFCFLISRFVLILEVFSSKLHLKLDLVTCLNIILLMHM